MQVTRSINTVEVHTGGEPFRIITSGLPRLSGRTIIERRAWVREHADDIRKALMFEPRGHADMYGGVAT
jgi:trans-L-3-hydroxyproline dehydratase